jgi:hypothetical protein
MLMEAAARTSALRRLPRDGIQFFGNRPREHKGDESFLFVPNLPCPVTGD